MLKKKKQKEKTMKRKTVPTSLPKKKKTPATPQMEVTMATVKEQELSLLSQEP